MLREKAAGNIHVRVTDELLRTIDDRLRQLNVGLPVSMSRSDLVRLFLEWALRQQPSVAQLMSKAEVGPPA